MHIIGIFFVTFGTIFIVFPHLVGVILGALLLMFGLSILLAVSGIKKSFSGNKVRFGDYELFVNKKDK